MTKAIAFPESVSKYRENLVQGVGSGLPRLVRTEGKIVTFGRRTAFTKATLADTRGKLRASANASLLVLDTGTQLLEKHRR